MAASSTHARRGARDRRLIRQWELVRALASRRRGATLQELAELLEVSRKTVQRELRLLESAGVPVTNEARYGTTRWYLAEDAGLPALGLSALQVAALGIARSELEVLEGSTWVQELDALLQGARAKPEQLPLRLPPAPPVNPAALTAIERAMRHGVQLHLEYRSVARGGLPEWVHVEPLVLNVADNTPYLFGYAVEREAKRTYRLSRVVRAEVTAIPARHRADVSEGSAFELSIKAWSGEPTRVRVRLSARVAWLVRDFPLVRSQSLKPNPDGSVTVSAVVSGTVEAMRWVLGWGAEAEVLEPAALRDATAQELDRALTLYRPVRKTTRAKTRGDRNAVRGRA